MSRSLPRPGQGAPHSSLRQSLSSMRDAFQREARDARQKAMRISTLALRAQNHPLADTNPGPPPELPDMQDVLKQARARASKISAITAGVATWKESYDLYLAYKAGDAITLRKVASSALKVGRRSMLAGRAASQRHLTIVSLDTLAHVIAWQSARRASKHIAWKALHKISSTVAGRAGAIMMAAEVFGAMRRDIERYRDGDLTEHDFYRNCALTGVSVVAPLAGASAGPVGGTLGVAVAIGAGMMRK